MKLAELNEKYVSEIVRLFEAYCGFGRNFSDIIGMDPEHALKNLQQQLSRSRVSKNHSHEYRVGSKWCSMSGLYFRADNDDNVTVKFKPNFSSEKKPEGLNESVQKFYDAVASYMN